MVLSEIEGLEFVRDKLINDDAFAMAAYTQVAIDEIKSLRAYLAAAKGEWVEGKPEHSGAYWLWNACGMYFDGLYYPENGAVVIKHMPILKPDPPEAAPLTDPISHSAHVYIEMCEHYDHKGRTFYELRRVQFNQQGRWGVGVLVCKDCRDRFRGQWRYDQGHGD